MNKYLAAAKKFVVDHKVAFSVASTALILQQINLYALRDHNRFLAEKGLINEFYSAED